MNAGFRGMFVMSWMQTELDGQTPALDEVPSAGQCWLWWGEPVRIDGPPSVLALAGSDATALLRRRAARSVQRFLGGIADPLVRDDTEDDSVLFEGGRGFVLTDGRQSWIATLIEAGPGRPPLVMFRDRVPPRNADLWVVRVGAAESARRSAGGVICFTPGTMILTGTGPMPVETLAEGDLVHTKDNGCQRVQWVGRRRVTGARMRAMPHLAPVRLAARALDDRAPDAALLVSPDHRLVLRGARAKALFNADEVLVAARDLVNDRSIRIERSLPEMTYIHLLLPRHEIVFANGVETDSFHPSGAGLTPDQSASLLARLNHDPAGYGDFARRVLGRGEAAILRHELN